MSNLRTLCNILNPYAWVMMSRRMLYHRGVIPSYKVPVPVISIGNLTVGGTGKTPTVILIAKYLAQKGVRVAVVTRGYGRASRGYLLLSNGKEILTDVQQSGDEPMVIAQAVTNAIVIADEDRVHGAQEAVKLGAEVILLDDGYQHLRLRRDLNILLIRSDRPLPPVLPFGLAREPKGAAKDADHLLFIGDEAPHQFESKPFSIAKPMLKSIEWLSGEKSDIVSLSFFQGKRVLAVTSIARPERFHSMLEEFGMKVQPLALADHATYDKQTVATILLQGNKTSCDVIVTTTKDAVKAKEFYDKAKFEVPIFVANYELEFQHGEQGFYRAIDQVLSPKSVNK